jgi:hypothetical protein
MRRIHREYAQMSVEKSNASARFGKLGVSANKTISKNKMSKNIKKSGAKGKNPVAIVKK